MSSHAIAHKSTLAKGKNVVLYDRDTTFMFVMKFLLEKLGFSVSLVSSVQNGLDLIHSRTPQLVIWGLNERPEVDFRMLLDARQMGEQSPYIILVSTPDTLHDDAPIEVLSTGDVFIKPFEAMQLARRIEWLVKHGKI